MKKLSLLFAALLAVSMSFATTVTKTVNELVTENEWTVSAGSDIGTLATNFALDNVVTVSTTGTPNCGSIWGTTTNDWRLYQNQNGNVTITAAEGYTLSIVKLTFNVAKTGVLLDAAGNTVASNSEIEVNAQNVTFTVGNSGTATNGQVKITAFEVTYLAVGDSTIIPVDTTIVPVDTTIVPVDTTIVPVDTTIVPVDTIALNCAEAREAALALDHNTPSTGIYAVTGYITEVVGNVSRNQQTFWMADTLEGGRVFEGYWANLPEGVEAFVEGMQIRMTGNLMRYNSTPEMKNGTVEILALPVVPDDTTIIPVDTTIVPVDTTIVPVDTIALNCAEAREAALALDHNTPSTGIYAVTGYITEVVGNVSRNQQTFWMADSLEGGRVFEGYWANLPEGIEAFEVGMQVRMTGNLMRYNSTPEMKNGTVEILAMPVVPIETVTIAFNATMWNTADAKFAAWVWGDSIEGMWTEFFVAADDSTDMYMAEIPVGTHYINFVRFADFVTTPMWEDMSTNIWNRIDNVVYTGEEVLFTVTDWSAGVWGVPEPQPVEPVYYYIKNAWGLGEWTWEVMVEDTLTGTWEYTGVYGGNGVNINIAPEDTENMIWIPDTQFVHVSDFILMPMDTILFTYQPDSNIMMVDLVGRPAVVPFTYYIKNNWEGGEWLWYPMAASEEDTVHMLMGVFGGTGVNINTAMTDEGAIWFPVDSMIIIGEMVPVALDTVLFRYISTTGVLYATVIGRPAPAPARYFIKNNWNGAADWTWVEMNPVMDNVLYEYTGVFGGTGVNINTVAEDNGSIWFPVENFSVLDSTFVPQALDTLHFVYSIVDSVLAVELVGRPVYNTCAEVNMITDTTDIELGEVTVVFAKGMNIYVKDATGTTLLYTRNYSNLVPGDRVRGIAGQAVLYRGLPELVPTTAYADLTVVPGEAPVIFDAQAAPTAANINEVMMFRGVHMPTASFTTSSATNIIGTFAGEQVAFRNNWKEAYDFDSTKTYSMLGCVATYNGTLQVYVTNFEEEIAPGQHYYIKNNWKQLPDWTWAVMTQNAEFDYQYEYTGVFGGFGVNINTAASDEGALWFPVESFDIPTGGLAPQALDTVYFNFNSFDSTIYAEVVGRPAPVAYNTCADVNAITGNTEITLNPVTVVFAKGSYIYVKDATATTLVYSNQYSALKPGDYVSGIAGTATLYNGLPELKPTTAFADLDITEYSAPRIPTAPGAPTIADINKVMKFNNVIMPADAAFSASSASNITGVYYGDSIIFRNQWRDAYTFDGSKTYSMIGCVGIYNGTIQVYVTDIQEYAPATYYIKNNWNGTVVWEWAQMTQNELFDYQYEYTGVFGGTGVNIDTEMSEFATFWFSVESFDIDPDGLVPQAGDTVYFNFNTLDETLYAHVVGRPTDVPVQYYIKNNWNGGEWTWEEMTPANDGNITWTYRGIFGGTGVNINNLPIDADAIWFPVDEWLFTTLGYVPEAGDDILFEFDSELLTLTATFMGEDGLETVTFQREGETMKLIHNGQLYIIRDGKMYNALGAQVR